MLCSVRVERSKQPNIIFHDTSDRFGGCRIGVSKMSLPLSLEWLLANSLPASSWNNAHNVRVNSLLYNLRLADRKGGTAVTTEVACKRRLQNALQKGFP